MTIGIGGAGSKLAAKFDSNATIINVSESELNKTEAGERMLAIVHAERGVFRGSRKNPAIGHDAYLSVRRELINRIEGDMVFSSTGGGTGNGISSGLLEDLSKNDDVIPANKTSFVFVLPYAKLEPTDYVKNTITFLQEALSTAIDSGNTGNIILVTNRQKFEERITEEKYNEMIARSLKLFLAVPEKNDKYKLLEGHIDWEDFSLYTSRPFFNHFTFFDYDPGRSFAEQLDQNSNSLLLPAEQAIEALFLLEMPTGWDSTCFYDVLQYFSEKNVSPVFSVIENPELERPFITVSTLYSRKPAELLSDYNHINEEYAKAKVRKSIEQHVALEKLEVNLVDEARNVQQEAGNSNDEEILNVLKRLGKL